MGLGNTDFGQRPQTTQVGSSLLGIHRLSDESELLSSFKFGKQL